MGLWKLLLGSVIMEPRGLLLVPFDYKGALSCISSDQMVIIVNKRLYFLHASTFLFHAWRCSSEDGTLVLWKVGLAGFHSYIELFLIL